MKSNSQILFFILWTAICLAIIHWVYLWISSKNDVAKIMDLNKLIGKNINQVQSDPVFIQPTLAQQNINHAKNFAIKDCSVPPTGLGVVPWSDWSADLPPCHQEETQMLALQSLADQDPRQAFCNSCMSGPVHEGFTSEFFDWMKSRNETPQQQDKAIFEPKDPLVPEDPVVKANDNPVFAYPGLDAYPNRETLPGNKPIPADSPASDKFDKPDAEKRQAVLNDASALLAKLNVLRKKAAENPVVGNHITSQTPNLPTGGVIDLPTTSIKNANKFVPSPEPINQSMGPNPVPNQRNFPHPIPNADYTKSANPRVIGYGEAKQIPTQPPGGPSCRFLNTPQCSPDFPYYTGANIGVAGGAQQFRCSGPEDAEVAEAVAVIDGGEIKKAYIVKNGKGYALPPKVKVIGGGGDGAKLETRLNPKTGQVVEIVVRNPGFGFHSTPVLELEQPGISDQCYLCCT